MNAEIIDTATAAFADTYAAGEPFKVRVVYNTTADSQLREERVWITPGYSTIADIPKALAGPRLFTPDDVRLHRIRPAQ
ncbi:hypothetical protein [Kitasatospora sp. NPDC090091]|uniref:hypothetical protein n=1 Tax=Kitasatospora sp. NPDC090091 TaxID=3364081 RepID=UPI0037FB2AD3